MSPRTYAVIGSNCFTGGHIVDALLDDPAAQVIGISRSPEYKPLFLPYKQRTAPQFRFYQIDLVDAGAALLDLLDRVKPQVVINVAALSEVALSNERPVEYFATNTMGVVQLCNHLRRRAYLERYVHISSAEIFGSCAQPVTEDTLYNPSTPYAVSKAAADMYIQTLQRHYDFPATLIRSTNVYGKHQQLFKIIPRTVIWLKLGKTITLHGGGKAIKSFIHIRDVVQGLQLALTRGGTETYHFSVASEQSIADIVRLLCTMLGYDFDAVTKAVDERLGQDARYTLDCRKAHHDLGWSPRVHFEDGVQEVVTWVETHWQEILQEPLEYIHKVPRQTGEAIAVRSTKGET
jgi:dTDP-glucose 4,6-dehydratase